MNRLSPVSAYPMTPVTSQTADNPAAEAAIEFWNSAEVASAPGVCDRNSATTELLPSPNSVSRRAATSADSEFAASQPPADRTDDVCVARTELATASRTEIRTMGRR